jgi:hypothetical protein
LGSYTFLRTKTTTTTYFKVIFKVIFKQFISDICKTNCSKTTTPDRVFVTTVSPSNLDVNVDIGGLEEETRERL